MNRIKSKLIIYALTAISMAEALTVFSDSFGYQSMLYNHYLYHGEKDFSYLESYPAKSYFLCGDDTSNKKIVISESNHAPDNENILLSDDKNIVFDNQKSHGLEFNNQTEYEIDAQSLLAEKPNLSFAENTQPQILIVHTHASESYGYKRTYPLADTDRTQDKEYNMVRIGKELKNHLENKGYKVLHDETIHDFPSYTSSYQRAGETIQKHLREHPSIIAVFDLHRDALVGADGKSTGLISQQNGEECAQIMMVCGTDQNNLKFDSWEENLRFAFKIQDYMEKHYPGLMRPINIRKERFNLHLTNGSILFEIGSSGNSLIQAINSVKYLADGIDKTLQNISKSY